MTAKTMDSETTREADEVHDGELLVTELGWMLRPDQSMTWSKTPMPLSRSIRGLHRATTIAMPGATESRKRHLQRRPRVDARQGEPHPSASG
jgi:hypothetical protein